MVPPAVSLRRKNLFCDKVEPTLRDPEMEANASVKRLLG